MAVLVLRNYLKSIFLVSLLLSLRLANATHIRAGEIIAKRINNLTLTFEFTVTGFRDTGSNIEFGGGKFDFGDGNSDSGPFRVGKSNAGNGIEMVTFTVTHTYDAFNGNGYIVSYQEDYRNDFILNMDNSVGTTFYVESLIVIDILYGLNNSPILTVPPIDFAAVGAKFIHNPGAYDPDGDSLSYSFITPKQARNKEVSNYRSLIDASFYKTVPFATGSEEGGIPNLSLNPITGDLIWDAPGDFFLVAPDNPKSREYNVAFVITEWRTIAGVPKRQGYVVRDMQIIVEDTDNKRPDLEVPDDFCVQAGEKASAIIQGTDPDGDKVKLEAFGGPFEVSNPATYSVPSEFQDSPGFLSFDWNTVCGHIRERPYEIQFKVTDSPPLGPRLVNFESMEITVVGPPPTGLQAVTQTGKSIQLTWNPYSCPNANLMQIWRKVGESEITPDDCEVGMPANTGFEMIDEVDAFTTSYLDNNNGIGLSPGATYCYRLVASFPNPGRGLSYVSEESCDSLIIDVPVITNVDILKTGSDSGEILVKWTPPYQIDQGNFPPTYTYDLFRIEGQRPSLDQTAVNSLEQIAFKTTDTLLVDTGLNTLNQSYTYFVVLYDGGNIVVDTSAFASSVRLTPRPLVKSIELAWSAVVPWSLRSKVNPYHYIYRDQVTPGDPSQIVLIDSVDVTTSGFRYLDNGGFNEVSLNEDIQYCYFVMTNGSYDNLLLPDPLINRSQVACAEPNDTIPPCRPPLLTVNNTLDCAAFFIDKSCGYSNFQNVIEWTVDSGPDCDNDIQYYNVYYSPTGKADKFEIVGTPVSTIFYHEGLSSFKGCYRVAAVDRSGNTSVFTEVICMDNCPFYELPNAFSPNGDGINEFFTPLYNDANLQIAGFDNTNCPRFVSDVEFKVFDRSGNKVYEYFSSQNENDITINWDGTNMQRNDLPAGVYFYEARVTYDVLNPLENKKVLKGWIQLLR